MHGRPPLRRHHARGLLPDLERHRHRRLGRLPRDRRRACRPGVRAVAVDGRPAAGRAAPYGPCTHPRRRQHHETPAVAAPMASRAASGSLTGDVARSRGTRSPCLSRPACRGAGTCLPGGTSATACRRPAPTGPTATCRFCSPRLNVFSQLLTADAGPFADASAPDPAEAMAHPLWFARHLYSLCHGGAVASLDQVKEAAARG